MRTSTSIRRLPDVVPWTRIVPTSTGRFRFRSRNLNAPYVRPVERCGEILLIENQAVFCDREGNRQPLNELIGEWRGPLGGEIKPIQQMDVHVRGCTGKRRFPTKIEALESAVYCVGKRGTKQETSCLQTYLCDHCRMWHLTKGRAALSRVGGDLFE